MKYPTDLLFGLAAAADGIPDRTEGELEIPTLLVPTVSIPKSLQPHAAMSRTLAQRDSFLDSLITNILASTAAASTTLWTFAKGLWQIALGSSFHCDFTSAPATDVIARVEVADPDVSVRVFFGFHAVGNFPQNQQWAFRVLLSRDGWAIRHRHSGTGVGQTLTMHTSIVANRLIP